MSQPLAIYASIPPATAPIPSPLWVGTQPVVVTNPFTFWPSLDWTGDNITPTSGYGEIPQYLFSVPQADPAVDTVATFTRRLTVGAIGSIFSVTTIPPGLYNLSLSHAADNQYSVSVTATLLGIPIALTPVGFNTNTPSPLQWRNVKTYEYLAISLVTGDTIDITSTVVNLAAPGFTPDQNPAMFTWITQFLIPVLG